MTIHMTDETRAKVTTILERVYEAGATPLNPQVVEEAVEELAEVFRGAYAAGVLWMGIGLEEGIRQMTGVALIGFPAEQIDEIREIVGAGGES